MTNHEPTKPPLLDSLSIQRIHPIPALTIAAHPDPRRIGEHIQLDFQNDRQHYEISRTTPLFTDQGRPLDSSHVSRKPFVLSHNREGLNLTINGCSSMLEVNGQQVTDQVFIGESDLQKGVFLEINRAVLLLIHLTEMDNDSLPDFGLIGNSIMVKHIRRDINMVRDLNVTVLIRGASGSGKELVARALHAQSKRRDKPMISVNLGAMPQNLAATELFGSMPGAFTNAVRRTGYFAAAKDGVLFLDEVAEASPEVQGALLRVLETNEIFPVGADKPIPVNVRLISASDIDFGLAVKNGQFKLPLLHRLSGFVIWLGKLQDRRDDIPILFRHFATEFLGDLGQSLSDKQGKRPWLSTTLMIRLMSHSWPGNIREFRNVIRQLIIFNQNGKRLEMNFTLENEDATSQIQSRQATEPHPVEEAPEMVRPFKISSHQLREALEVSQWEPGPAAKALGISRSAIYALFKRYPGFRKATDVTREELEETLKAHDNNPKQAAKALEVSAYALFRYAKKLDLIN